MNPRGMRLRLRGVVQGIGFRPFVYRLSRRLQLRGRVRNSTREVIIEAWGTPEALDELLRRLPREAPPLARIQEVERQDWAGPPPEGFTIEASRTDPGDVSPVPPDLATCPACLREVLDPDDRRHAYPFTNCTLCGPRFTIVRQLPYDRARTTMSGFRLCPDCRREYRDPADRRFHAQPTACPVCGPRLELWDGEAPRPAQDPLAAARTALEQGRIVALKGLGGFQLACDAASPEAVAALRARKQRPTKPLAIMVADLEAARAVARVEELEAELLCSPHNPIVLCEKRDDPRPALAPEVAPGMAHLGIFLPTTPLHHLLFRESAYGALVMTSGNRSEEPILIDGARARVELGGIADLFLDHDRPIHNRCDDSVLLAADRGPMMIRRARGYTPLPVDLPVDGPVVLALGAELKSTFCLARGRRAYLSQHIGELQDSATLEFLEESVRKLERWLEARVEAVACDAHPDYLSSRLAERLARERGLPLHRVQHHHAHAAAVLAERDHPGPALALAFDGVGYGPDGTVWGGELLRVDRRSWARLGSLSPFRLPGGDLTAREGWRVALSLAHRLGLPEEDLPEPIRRDVPPEALRWVQRQIDSGQNAPLSTSAGRLFDAVAAAAGVCLESRFEGEAPMRLEAEAHRWCRRLDPPLDPYQYRLLRREGRLLLESEALFQAVLEDLRAGAPAGRMALRFHETLAAGGVEMAHEAGREAGAMPLILTGGVFQNRLLLARTARRAEAEGFELLLPEAIPPNDGGIALGQAAIVRWGGSPEPEDRTCV